MAISRLSTETLVQYHRHSYSISGGLYQYKCILASGVLLVLSGVTRAQQCQVC